MLQKVVGCALVLVALIAARSSADAPASLRAISLGVLQYAPARGDESSYAIDINDHGQVLGISASQYTQWQEGMLWQPTLPGATTGVLHDVQELVGAHSPGRGWQPSQLGGNGEIGFRGGLFVPNEPNGLTGQVKPAFVGTIPNHSGYSADDDGTTVYRLDPAGGRTAVYTHAQTSTNNIAMNNAGVIAGYAGSNLDAMYLWTPDATNGATGSAVTFNMRFQRGSTPNLLLNELNQVVSSNWALYSSGSYLPDAYLYRPGPGGGTVTVLDTLLGVDTVEIFDINDRGQMLAYLANDDAFLGNFLLTPNGTGGFDRLRLDDLTQRIDAQTLVRAFYMTALNNSDQLVGRAQWSTDNGVTWKNRATMLVVPEPGAMGLAAVGLIVGLKRRSSR